jgi:hypothetical protein
MGGKGGLFPCFSGTDDLQSSRLFQPYGDCGNVFSIQEPMSISNWD